MSRDALYKGSVLGRDERDALLNAFLSVCSWTRVFFLWRPNLRDEGDNHVVELAIAGMADAIVTKNLRDFRRMEIQFPELRILAPETLIKEIL